MCWYTILGIKDNLERGFRSGCQMGEPWSWPSPRSFSHDMQNGTGAVPLSYSHCIEWQLWGLEIAAVPLVLRHKTYLYRSHGRNETLTFDNATDRWDRTVAERSYFTWSYSPSTYSHISPVEKQNVANFSGQLRSLSRTLLDRRQV